MYNQETQNYASGSVLKLAVNDNGDRGRLRAEYLDLFAQKSVKPNWLTIR